MGGAEGKCVNRVSMCEPGPYESGITRQRTRFHVVRYLRFTVCRCNERTPPHFVVRRRCLRTKESRRIKSGRIIMAAMPAMHGQTSFELCGPRPSGAPRG